MSMIANAHSPIDPHDETAVSSLGKRTCSQTGAPEGQKKLADGGAKRNHRNNAYRPSAPAGAGESHAISRFSRPSGADHICCFTGGSATLHHRLISFAPPGRQSVLASDCLSVLSAALVCLLVFLPPPSQVQAADAYTVEDIAPPPNVVPECGGISFLPDGRLVAVFHHGEVYIYTPATKAWKQFAEGLHDPMGVLAISPTEILITQRPELTRLTDTDGDGVADKYECASDSWGISGNYHEFVCGMVRDKDGNLFIPVTSGSNGSVARYEVRGTFNPDGYVKTSHFSAVPYRGCVVKIAPDGKLSLVASGLRQPNGIAMDPQGRVFVSDNQGDWVGTSKLHHVVAGRFYGHAASSVWRDDFVKGRSVDDLDRMRTEGAVLFPHAILANSPGQPIFDTTGGKFGPFAGQMFVTEFNIPRLLRVMLEEVTGELQGAATSFFDGPPLHSGSHRLAFAPDGALWVAQSERKLGWPGGAGIQRIVWNGQPPMEVSAIHLTKTGFELTFTKPLDPATSATDFKARRYYYQYHETYGSPQTDIHPVAANDLKLSENNTKLAFTVDTLAPGYIYEFTLSALRGPDGEAVKNKLLCYTANRLLDGSKAPIPRPAPTGEMRGSGKDKPTEKAD